MDWVAWHRDYDEETPLKRRLAVVRRHIADALGAAAPGPIRALSVCAGDGRDLLGALDGQPRRRDVRARLVELDPDLAARARRTALDVGAPGVEVVVADAGTTSAYAGAVPADLVLVCGVFGNITDAAIETTIRALPSLCSPGATVIWTRHRRPPDLTPAIRGWFASAGFAEVAYEPVPDSTGTVGVARLATPPPPFRADVRLFEFLDRSVT